jgi:hypothetical protein
MAETLEKVAKCEVCGGTPPEGHRFCDDCWSEKAIAAGKAALCQQCQTPKVLEKLQKNTAGLLLCQKCHSSDSVKP